LFFPVDVIHLLAHDARINLRDEHPMFLEKSFHNLSE